MYIVKNNNENYRHNTDVFYPVVGATPGALSLSRES